MFITSGLFPDILYVYISILASVITGVFLFASLMKTGRLRKAVYVSCGSILLIFILPVAVYSGFIDPVYALLAGMLVVSFLWGVFRYERLWRQNRALLLCILALMLTFVQIVVVWIPVFLPDILSFVFHYELEIPGGSTISLFYLSLSLGIPLLFASYLPRRNILRWMDRAAVVVSAAAFAADCLRTCAELSEPACRRSARCAGPHRLFTDGDRLCAAPDGRKEARPQSLRAAGGHGDRAILF